ncbi:MAG TPA: phenylalanine--tRNA ligase subunit alpha [Gemmatimonadales bacterium]|nr:phenylalanine--tRNA ligase subunit alpha [Gemmatimonadales bacterium]
MAHGTLDDELAAIARRIDDIPTADARQLEDLKTALLGRKAGALTAILRSVATLPPDDKRRIGSAANQLKLRIEEAVENRRRALADPGRTPGVDLTLPGRQVWRGSLHPLTQAVDEICAIFGELGFSRVVGPEAELESYNFTKLNIPLDHPAADEHDTFYLDPGIVLRTHTSPMQARIMERYPPPIRIVVPGLCYRRDPWDASHAPAFDQIEGLVVDEGVSFVDFKAAIDFFVRRFFAPDTRVRFRPSFFPFTEPSAEVDAQCQVCQGAGCATCKQTGWMEIMGAGMVHPAVFEACGLDSERYTGFAFGMGPGRIAMVRYGIPDIRMLFQNDMRFLDQFAD